MNSFLVIRYVIFAFFILFCGLVASFAALNLSFMTGKIGQTIEKSAKLSSLNIFLMITSFVEIFCILPIIGVEIYRKGAYISRIWFELVWISVFFLVHLGGAIASVASLPMKFCTADVSLKMACKSTLALVAFSWITTAIHVIYYAALLLYAVRRSKYHRNVWNTAVLDHVLSPPTTPGIIGHSHSNSFDSHVTLVGGVQPFVIPLSKNAYGNLSPTRDKELKYGNGILVHKESFTTVDYHNGPATFGRTHPHAFAGRDEVDLGSRVEIRSASNTGVNAINGAPVYHPPPGLSRQRSGVTANSHAHDYSDPAEQFADSELDYPHFNPGQVGSPDETPSPAVIQRAHRVMHSLPALSLYPQHVVEAGLTPSVRALPQPPAPQPEPADLSELHHAAGLDVSPTSLPYLKSRRSSISSEQSRRTSFFRRSIHHGQALSVDLAVQLSPEVIIENKKARKAASPRRRPPPLNLSGLSNIVKADRR